jgi:CheY-like chemotaxis protein
VSAYLSKPVSRIELLQASAMLIASGGSQHRNDRLITRFSMEESRRARHILLVDDSPVNRQVAVTMLHRRGHQVDAFADAGEAVQAMETTAYDCVLACATLDGVESLCREGAPSIIATVNPGHRGGEANDFAAGAEQCIVMPPEV